MRLKYTVLVVLLGAGLLSVLFYLKPSGSPDISKAPGLERKDVCHNTISSNVKEIFQLTSNCSQAAHLSNVDYNCESLILCKFKVVSAISDNHFQEAVDSIGSFQAHMPQTPILVYDIGLSSDNLKVLQSFCNVETRKFNFSKYPRHVWNLINYAWKPIIVNEVLSADDVEVILWSDASTRLMRPLMPAFPLLSQQSILAGAIGRHRPFISMVHRGMMDYLKLNKTRKFYTAVKASLNANIIMFWASGSLTRNFLRHWLDCAMHEECIAPAGSSKSSCHWSTWKFGEYACHRYDQAAYNSILVREYGIEFVKRMTNNSIKKYFKVARHPTSLYTARTKGNCLTL